MVLTLKQSFEMLREPITPTAVQQLLGPHVTLASVPVFGVSLQVHEVHMEDTGTARGSSQNQQVSVKRPFQRL